MTVLQNFGRLPYLVRAGEAEVELRLDTDAKLETRNANPNGEAVSRGIAVYALGTDGRRKCAIPCEWVSSEGTRTPGGRTTGALRFKVSSRQPFGGCMYYEIVRE